MSGSLLRPPERPRITARAESFPLEREFTIARGSKTKAEVVLVELADGTRRGRGESVPYARYGETVDGVLAQIEQVALAIETGQLTRRSLQRALPAGAARNALDCALWDFESKRAAGSVWQLAGLELPHRLVTAYTIVLDSPERMAHAAAENAHRPLLKIKLGAEGDLDRLAAVRAAAPQSRLIVDANEGWTADALERYLPDLAASGVELVEQPLPEGADGALADIEHIVPICADESCHTVADLGRLTRRHYDAINIKLDKAGGLTAALELRDAAREAGFRIMIGCMVATSLGVAPAVLLAQDAEWVDLDAPLLLARDRQPGLRFDGSVLYPATVSLWG